MNMIKPLMLASALFLGTAAIAQTTPQPSGQTVDDPSQSTGPQGITQQGTDPDGQSNPGAAAGQYPPCSRTVTDSCVQTYERGSAPRARSRRGRR
jgi:hypothetical protein